MSSLILAASRQRVLLPSASSLMSRLVNSGNYRVECFSTKALTGEEYSAAKRATKNSRREAYASHEARKERAKKRRVGKPRDVKKNEFRAWFVQYKVNDEYMDRKARQAGLDWKIHVAVALERPLKVVPDFEEWELEWKKLKAHIEEQTAQEYPPAFQDDDPYDSDSEGPPTTAEELAELLPAEVVLTPKETEADATGDVRTTNRKLQTSVFLTVKNNNLWQLPSVPLQPDETLLQAAKRAIAENVGDKVNFWCPSNCPCGVQMVRFDEEKRIEGFYGIKTFVMRFEHVNGDVAQDDLTVEDFAWLDRGELIEKVKEERGETAAKFYRYLL